VGGRAPRKVLLAHPKTNSSKNIYFSAGGPGLLIQIHGIVILSNINRLKIKT